MTFEEEKALERRRLRFLNPHVIVMGDGWQKLCATARVNVWRRKGVYNQVAEEVLQSHKVGMDANIVITGEEPPIQK